MKTVKQELREAMDAAWDVWADDAKKMRAGYFPAFTVTVEDGKFRVYHPHTAVAPVSVILGKVKAKRATKKEFVR